MAKKSPSDVKAGGASVTIGGDDSLFSRVIKGTEKRLQAFAAKAREIGTRWSVGGGGFVAGAAAIAHSFMDIASTAGSMAPKIGLSAGDVQAAMSMKAAWIEVMQAVFALKNAVGAALAPAFTAAFKAVAPLIRGLTAWVKANPGLVRMIAIASGIVMAFGVALVALGVAVTALLSVLSSLATIFAVITSAKFIGIAVLIGGVTTLGKLFTNLGGNIGGWAKAVKDTFAAIIKYVNWLATGIGDALMGGDAMLAIEIFWKGFQLAGLKAIRAISDAMKKALGSLYVNLGGQSFLGITDAQLKAREQELQNLINQANKLPQNAQNAAGAIPKVLANSPIAANARFSAGAASTIARAYNSQQSIPLKQVMLLQKIYGQLQKNGNVKPVKVKQVKGP